MNKILAFVNTNKIFNNILLYLILIFCFEPKLFVKFSALNYLYVAGIILSAIFISIKYIIIKKKPNAITFILIAYQLSYGLQTIIAHGDILMWGYLSIVLFTLSMVIPYYIQIDKIKCLNSIVYVLCALLVVNTIISFIFPNGIIDEIYFIGIRTRFTDVVFPLVVLTLIVDKLNGKRIGALSVFVIILSAFTILKFKIATAYIGAFVFILCLLIFFIIIRRVKVNSAVAFGSIIIAALILNNLLVSNVIINAFSWLIEGVLGKSITLSGRTNIWEVAIDIVIKKPVFGYGMYENGNFIWLTEGGEYWESVPWQAHNQWLQILHDGGSFSLIIFCLLFVYAAFKIDFINCTWIKTVLYAGFIAFIVQMFVEIYSYTPYFYLLPIVASQGEYIGKKDKRLIYKNYFSKKLEI